MARVILVIGAAVIVVALTPTSSSGQDWGVSQNIPNPFCNDPECPEYGETQFTFSGDSAAEIVLEIWSPDTTSIVRGSDPAALAPGVYLLMWDGTDDYGVPLPEGAYPYRLAIRPVGSLPVTYTEWQVAEISCDAPTEERSWGAVKNSFRQGATSN